MRQSFSDRRSVTATMGVEPSCDGLEKAVSTLEPVSDVFLYAKRRVTNKLKGLRLKANQRSEHSYSDILCVRGHVVVWGGGGI